MKHVEQYFATARERYSIKLKRETGADRPWTTDPIFDEWRFCNVHREDDKTTAWFREHVRSKLSGAAVAQATLIFRWFNRIEIGERIIDLLLDKWSTREARKRLEDVRPVVTGAYMLKTPEGMNKLDGVLWCIEQALPTLPDVVAGWGNSLREAWQDLCPYPYMGPFTSYEVISDLRWTPVLSGASDIMTWANAGPGCARGLGRVMNGDRRLFNRTNPDDQIVMNDLMRDLRFMSEEEKHWPQAWPRWEMREVEHWACEFQKYCNAAEGKGLKRRFR